MLGYECGCEYVCVCRGVSVGVFLCARVRMYVLGVVIGVWECSYCSQK